jgi:hypothetical protein
MRSDRKATPCGSSCWKASSVVAIDYTAADVLAVIRTSRARGADFAVARLESVRAEEAFRRFGLTELLGSDHMFRSVEEAVQTRKR